MLRSLRRCYVVMLCVGGVMLFSLVTHKSVRHFSADKTTEEYPSSFSSSSSSSSSQTQGKLSKDHLLSDSTRQRAVHSPAPPPGMWPPGPPGSVRTSGDSPYSFPATRPKDSHPEPKDSHPEPKDTHPEPKDSHPKPEPKDSHPEPKDSHPEPKDSHPVPKDSHPEPKDSHPKPKDSHPKPEPKDSHPEPAKQKPSLASQQRNASSTNLHSADLQSSVSRHQQAKTSNVEVYPAHPHPPHPSHARLYPATPTPTPTPKPFPSPTPTPTPTPKPFPTNPVELFSAHNVSGESPELLEDLYRRFLRVETSCRNRPAHGRVAGVFTDDASRMAYCFLPKAGCTFWIRVFSYLHNYTGDSTRSPWDIPRLKLHNNKHSHGVSWRSVRSQAQDYLRFLFVRHPFSRLWSAYVDKLFLPDFWSEIGTKVVRKLRGANATRQALRCGHDVTFSEFVEYSLTTSEPHWDPIYLRCDPCQFRPTVVGELKSFSPDSLFLLRRMGLEWVWGDGGEGGRAGRQEKELTTLVTYNFERVHSQPFYRHCLSDSGLSRKLWTAFQINGYIPDTAPQPSASPGRPLSLPEFRAHVLAAVRAAWPWTQQLRRQKRHYLTQALTSLTPDLLARVKDKYWPDMLYFGFNDTNY